MRRPRAHIVPRNDERVHAYRVGCWCCPAQVYPGVWVHNAMDRRELYERREGSGIPGKPWATVFVRYGRRTDPGCIMQRKRDGRA